MYTNSEQLCFNQHFAEITGIGLSLPGSYFNHSCTPNVARYNVGDVLVFRTNSAVAAGAELCISYIESEILSEPAATRTEYLGRDFAAEGGEGDEAGAAGEGGEGGEGGAKMPLVNEDVQQELYSMNPLERLEAVEELLADAEAQSLMLAVDHKELAAMSGLTCGQLGASEDALGHWRKCLTFATEKCPPNDESTVCYAVQCALSALAAKDQAQAAGFLRTALEVHGVVFGDGTAGQVGSEGDAPLTAAGLEFFRVRFQVEVDSCAFGATRGKALWALAQGLVAGGALPNMDADDDEDWLTGGAAKAKSGKKKGGNNKKKGKGKK